MTIQPLDTIRSCHAHVYLGGPERRRVAEALRERIGERFAVTLGINSEPVPDHDESESEISPNTHPTLTP